MPQKLEFDYREGLEVESIFNKKLETLTFKLVGEAYSQVMDFKDQKVRESLIALGWTPPDKQEK